MSRASQPFPRDERESVGDALRSCLRILIAARQSVAAADLPPAKLFMVDRGVALVSAVRPGRRRPIILSLAGAGAVLPPLRAEQRLGGLIETVVVAIPGPACDQMLASPPFAAMLVDSLLEALNDRQESLSNATGGRQEDRLRCTLYQLARTHGKVCRDGVEIALPLTHDLLAQMLGCARETVTCGLARLRRDGLLTENVRGYRLAIPPAALEGKMTIPAISTPDAAPIPSESKQLEEKADPQPQHAA
jgi:hypothetical protein